MRYALIIAALLLCRPAFAETFDEAWASRWRPRVTGSFMSRRFEPEIKAAAREIWDVAQQNAVKAGDNSRAILKATPAQRPPVQRRPARRRFFRRGLFR